MFPPSVFCGHAERFAYTTFFSHSHFVGCNFLHQIFIKKIKKIFKKVLDFYFFLI